MVPPFSKKLNNSRKIPILGLGTYQGYLHKPCMTEEIVKKAIDSGYRLFDCSPIYGNQDYVGKALNEKIRENVVKRKDLFIVTKLWNSDHKKLNVMNSLEASLRTLCLDYVDLFLINWPFAHTNNIDYIETWYEMQKCVDKNLTKGIGVCNFNCEQIDRLLRSATIKPVVNQVECHINLNQKKLRDFCKERNIAVMGYSPFGDINAPTDGPYSGWKSCEKVSLDVPEMKAIAEKHKKTVHQIALRYLAQLGVVTIPKSITENHIIENINIFDFQLNQEEIFTIDKLSCEKRIYTASQYRAHKFYPFH